MSSVKSELKAAEKEYNASPTWETLTRFKEKEEAYKRTEEGVQKLREEDGDTFEVFLLEKIVQNKSV